MIDNSAQVEQTQPTSPVSTGTDGGGAGGSQPPPGTGTSTGTGTTTGTGTPTGGATNAPGGGAGGTGGTPNAGAGSSGGGGGGGGGGGLIDAWGVVTDVWDGLVAGAINMTQSLIDMFSRSLLTLPAAGSIDDPTSWFLGGVSDPNWLAMAGVYVLSSSLALVFLLISTSINLSMPRHQRRREVMVRFAWGIVAITIGFGMLQGYNHLWNGVAMGFAPSGEEFLATPGNTAKFGAGLAAIAGLLMTGNAVAIAAGVLIHAAFVFLTYGLVAVWPFSVAMYLSKAPVVSEVGKATIVVTLALGPLQALKGVFLRVLFVLPIQPSNPETLFQFFVIVAGVAIAFTVLPYMGLKRLLPRTIVGVGMGGIQTATEETGKRLRDRAPSREQIQATLVGSDDNAARSKSKLGQRSGSATGTASAASSRGRNRRRSYRSTSRGLSRRSGVDTRSRSQSRGGQSMHTGNVAYRQRRRRRTTTDSGGQRGSTRQTRNRGGRGR